MPGATVPEPVSGRDERYRRQVERVTNERDHYRRAAVDAVAALLLRTGDHLDLMEGEDLAAVLARAWGSSLLVQPLHTGRVPVVAVVPAEYARPPVLGVYAVARIGA